jgi:hypothetical protein
VKGSSGPLSASIQPGTHHPAVKSKWPLEVTATLAGKPAHATSLYLFMLGPSVVSTQHPFGKNPYRFTGHYKDTFTWPADSLGQSLTLRVVVSAGGHTVHLDWAVTPTAAARPAADRARRERFGAAVLVPPAVSVRVFSRR